MSAQVFQCPNCGGQIPLSTGTEKSVVCPFCNNTVIVPPELRSTAVQPRVQPQVIFTQPPVQEVDISPDTVRKGALAVGGFTLATVLLPLIITCVIVIAVGVAVFGITGSVQTSLKSAVEDNTSSSSGDTSGGGIPAISFGPTAAPPFASVVQQFGSEGSGPGQFKDARYIGLDAEGDIYVAQYMGGRVQVFDPQGKYLTEWSVDRKQPLTGFAVSRRGVVYTSQFGKIELRDGKTGQVTGSLSYTDGDFFDSLWLMPNGTLVTSWYDNSDDIVVFDPQGQTSQVIKGAISTVTGDAELDTTVAADGDGNIYALGAFSNAVFKFSPEGKYQNKFGSDGDNPGQFRAPLAIATDGQGRVYVNDFKGVQVFSPDGQYVGLIDVSGAAYGVHVDDSNHVWVVAGTQVTEYALASP